LDGGGVIQLSDTWWTVSADSDRIGVRLLGARLGRRPGDVPTEPVMPGAVQVPADGLPIVLGRDAGVTGGYPVVGVVSDESLDRIAQLRPGDQLRLRPVQ
jgi:allophanate hydrolase subunit 2